MSAVYRAVKEAAARLGAQPDMVELIGLVPEAAIEPESEWMELTTTFSPRELWSVNGVTASSANSVRWWRSNFAFWRPICESSRM